ncbi:putative NADP-dependent mannitol dehydrogenase [Exophiala viscosa]|uniref:NADP-dependent mannitol dehydrogenase n=1 Tax=Exophiala viscosa TaxID=2486360 RepID=A0AAN6E3M2_9EURO|nr:putative NADP-dependent mannitol dehydrogenase [Exophiala viscosa]
MSMTADECSGLLRAMRQPPIIPTNVFEKFSMKSRVVCISGSSDGIGFAVAEAMAEAGANLALWYNSNKAAVSKGAELAARHGIKVKAYQVEVSNADHVRQTMSEVVEHFGRLDVFVANAGIGLSRPLQQLSLEDYRRQMAVNVDGTVYCAKYAGEVFQRQGQGNLIITSSVSGHIVNVPNDQPVYNASKAAITHLGKSLAREWRQFARVNIVSPGIFDTNMVSNEAFINEAVRMTALGRMGNVQEVKGLYLYLASDASSFMTGSDVILDGGYTLP